MSSIIYSRKYAFHLYRRVVSTFLINASLRRIPFYHAEEATNAVIPLLGNSYHTDKRAYLPCLWESFTKCQWVEPDNPEAERKDRTMWYRSGRIGSLKGK